MNLNLCTRIRKLTPVQHGAEMLGFQDQEGVFLMHLVQHIANYSER
jgi:hypothetical protein